MIGTVLCFFGFHTWYHYGWYQGGGYDKDWHITPSGDMYRCSRCGKIKEVDSH